MTREHFTQYVQKLKMEITKWEAGMICCHDLRDEAEQFVDSTPEVQD